MDTKTSERLGISLTRIFSWSIVFFALPAGLFSLSAINHQPLPADQPWVPLPKTPMDVASYPTRRVMVEARDSIRWYKRNFVLAGACGNEHDYYVERYGILVGEAEQTYRMGPYLHINIEFEWNTAVVAYSNRYRWPLFENGYRPFGWYEDHELFSSEKKIRIERDKLDKLRSSWLNPALWENPQGKVDCRSHEGVPILLEACIKGKYAVRYRHCADNEREPAKLLRRELDVLIAESEQVQEF